MFDSSRPDEHSSGNEKSFSAVRHINSRLFELVVRMVLIVIVV